MTESNIPENGVSRKLKAVVYILTDISIFAFVAFFAKLATKYTAPKKQEKTLKTTRVSELNQTGERLQEIGYLELALDQYIKIWNVESTNPTTRSEAAFKVGKLYLKLGNCKESLVWLFRSEAANPDLTDKLQPLIDSCIQKNQ